MKKNLINYAVAIAISLGVLGCSKDGEVGPQGPKGDKGEQGITGKDGSTFLSGTTNPTASIGKEGDFFINLSARTLFGPKKGSDWGPAKVLSGEPGKDGAQGPAGENGNTILNGKGAPTAAFGKVGDFYLDTETLELYGAKTSKGWGTAVNLKAGSENDVTVLLYSSQTVQNIKIDEEQTKQNQAEVTYLEKNVNDLKANIVNAENRIKSTKERYDQELEKLRLSEKFTEAEKKIIYDQLTSGYNNNIRPFVESLRLNNESLTYSEARLNEIKGLEFYVFNSLYILPKEYQEVYDNGMTIIQFRKSPPAISIWEDEGMEFSVNSTKYLNIYRSNDSKESEIILHGNSHRFTKKEVEETKFDIKVTLIPSSEVIEMKAKKVNLNDPKAVIKHLKN